MVDRPQYDEDTATALRDARERFTNTFPGRVAAMRALTDTIGAVNASEAAESLRHEAHRLAGFAGMVGFRTISEQARQLESLATPGRGVAIDRAAITRSLDAMLDAFGLETKGPAPAWAVPAAAPATSSARILLVEDDRDQAEVVRAALTAAGHQVVWVPHGNEALASVRDSMPSLVLLDIDLPGLDGLSICRSLKADPALHSIPVMFMTARVALADRLTGLTLGADDYLVKPVDPSELQMRINLVLRRLPAVSAPGPVLSYDAFASSAAAELRKSDAAVALVRVPRGRFEAVAKHLLENLRRRDLLGRYDDSHAIVLLPELTAGAASARLREIATASASAGDRIQAGLAISSADARNFESLLSDADEALGRARAAGDAVAVHGGAAPAPTTTLTIVIAEDEPDIARIIDAQLKGAGYRTMLTFDGRRALEAIRTSAADAVVLDLMLPGMTGFEVLDHLRRLPDPTPHTVIVSARGRETDVTRAFELGADDYVMKPFSPQELLARLARLLR